MPPRESVYGRDASRVALGRGQGIPAPAGAVARRNHADGGAGKGGSRNAERGGLDVCRLRSAIRIPRRFVRFLVATGARLSDALAVRWRDVNEHYGDVAIRGQKTNRPLRVAMLAPARSPSTMP